MHGIMNIHHDIAAGRWLCCVVCQCGEYFIQSSTVEDNTLYYAMHNAVNEYWEHRSKEITNARS